VQTVQRSALKPPPGIAIIPLGTGNNLARYFGWGKKFDKRMVQGYDGLFHTLRDVAQAGCSSDLAKSICSRVIAATSSGTGIGRCDTQLRDGANASCDLIPL
jgi:diacylglycerol kinase family enzyme